ncbi:acidic mammalian chitinase-like [Lutzomyia longipalpis]|uniref:acidic mammalian chitinase-like n=1 Tax=Lutzomyia longipalpis TaxID=7200 RepID=UPI0024845E4C|nr:acidic mammalian chitinase-like [Lutzomyia longipalpis]
MKIFFSICALSVTLVALAAVEVPPENQKKVFCVHGKWSAYRKGDGHFGIEQINPLLCTHLVYTFFGIDANGEMVIRDPWLDLEENDGQGNLRKLIRLREINPDLRILASVGGWIEGSDNFSEVSHDGEKRKAFVRSSINFLEKYRFDGLDLDWEYPGRREGSKMSDKEAFTKLVKDLHDAFKSKGLLLTAMVASEQHNAAISYDIPQISKYLDFIKLKTYELHGFWSPNIGHNSPLYGKSWEKNVDRFLNIHSGVRYWLESGAPAEKIIVGVPLYGRGFKMVNEEDNVIGSPHLGPSDPALHTNDAGFIGFNELCEKQLTEQWEEHWDDEQLVPYTTRGDQWIGYDNEESLRIKANYVRRYKLGGIMVGNIENDDYLGICGKGLFPLLREINRALEDKSSDQVIKSNKTCP